VPLPDSWRVLQTRKDSDSHPPPLPGGGLPVCTGPDFRNPNRKSRKREKGKRSEAKCFLSRATRLPQQKLCTICKFCMIFVVLIPVKNYNSQIAFKRGLT